MTTKVKTNMGAIRSLNTLNKNARAAQKNLRKVATGERINSAADDASAWGISERMREKIRSLDQANDNAQNDLAMMRTAEGAVANIVDTLRTLKQKAIDSANDSNTDEDRRIMQKEVDQLLDQIDDNALVTFNGKFLVNGNLNNAAVTTRYVLICKGLYQPDENHTPAPYHTDPIERKLTDLLDRNGMPLGIEESDTFTISHVINGKTYTRTDSVRNYKLGDIIGGYKEGTFRSWTGSRYRYDNGYEIAALVDETVPFYPDRIFHDEDTSNAQPNDPENTLAPTVLWVPFGNFSGIHGGIFSVPDKTGQPLIVPDAGMGVVFVAGYFKSLKRQVSSITITIKTGGGEIRKNATHALKFTMLQRGEGPSDSNNGRGLASTAATFHVGAGANQSMTVGLSDMRSKALGLASADGSQKISIKTRDDAIAAIDVFDSAINSALDQLTSIGALEARLEYTIGNITTSTENVQASDSTNRDADMAREMTNFTRDNILTQAAQAMLAQANQDASSILSLLS